MLLDIRIIATNFRAVLGVCCFKPIPSIVMFGMKEFYISASGAIQGNQGPLVIRLKWGFYVLDRVSEEPAAAKINDQGFKMYLDLNQTIMIV